MIDAPPKTIWVFQRPDGHWEIRFEKPDVAAHEYRREYVCPVLTPADAGVKS